MRTLSVVGARPNFVKMAPVLAELRRRMPGDRHVLVHSGQHYDRMMSEIFFEELGVPEPDHSLGVGSGTHSEQTARVMERLEPVLLEEAPDLVIVSGDVNSTLGAALVAAKANVPLAHVEAGLRSYDRTMPEEVNRIVADEFSSHLFAHSEEAIENLAKEGIAGENRVHLVGNTMIDSLVAMEERFRERQAAAALGLEPGGFILVTLHRPALVDGPLLGEVMDRLVALAATLPVLFPAHPRTRQHLSAAELPGVHVVEPVGYLDFLSLQADAAAVLTDSGGVQEETTYLGIPCFTLRATTERPVTIRSGTNTLLGLEPAAIDSIPGSLAQKREAQRPPLWDGHAAERILDVLG